MVPVQDCDATHDTALVDDHVSVSLPPVVTEEGLTEIVTVGAGVVVVTTGVTVTAAET